VHLFGIIQRLLYVSITPCRKAANRVLIPFALLVTALILTSEFRFDPASLVILDRVNYAISLLERQPAGDSVLDRRFAPEEVLGASPASLITLQSSGQHAAANASPSDTVAVDDGPGHIASDHNLSGIPEYPASVMNCEATMRWPVFAGSVPNVKSFILDADADSARPSIGSTGACAGIREEDFIPLSKKFLAYVHVKNPILDPAEYRSYVWEAVSNGIGWDGPSCLVVCAIFSPQHSRISLMAV
jgi:hypothetical protein